MLALNPLEKKKKFKKDPHPKRGEGNT